MRSLVQVQDGPFGVGGLAQLVERLLCKQDVSGSSPLTSTEYHLFHKLIEGNCFRCDQILNESSFLIKLIKMLESLIFFIVFREP